LHQFGVSVGVVEEPQAEYDVNVEGLFAKHVEDVAANERVGCVILIVELEIVSGVLNEVAPRLYPGDVRGAGTQRSESPPSIMRGDVQDSGPLEQVPVR